MSELKKQATTLYAIMDGNQFAWEHISREDKRWSEKWVTLGTAIKAVADKNRERFAEINELEEKVEKLQTAILKDFFKSAELETKIETYKKWLQETENRDQDVLIGAALEKFTEIFASLDNNKTIGDKK